MNDDELGALHDLIQFMLWGFADPSPDSKSGFIAAVKGGQTIASIVTGWEALPAHATWNKTLAALAALDLPALVALAASARFQANAIKSLAQ